MRERDRTGKTALHYCAENATADIVQLLLVTQQQQQQFIGPNAAAVTTSHNAFAAASALESLLNAADEEGYTVTLNSLTISIITFTFDCTFLRHLF